MARLEYEKKRDVGSRIAKLESTIANLENALRDVKKKQKELESAVENANTEIEDLNEQVEGNFKFCFIAMTSISLLLYCFVFHLYGSILVY